MTPPKVEPELLWNRITARLAREPSRAAYREDSRQWMDATNGWYSARDWDFSIENNEKSVQDLMNALITCVAAHDTNIGELCESAARRGPDGYAWTGPVSPHIKSSPVK